ncbi:DUF4190 domain-containing protein [Microbacterium flavum]|uniref:DUF4190 domain-containing protein n=1 Tax=Microbacterium flavum TaxID=415216 RepID=A0ABS5XVT3_9MICO|nr:DUF4190 domain-containing protein [Microbacterium flavum]MBT8798526.1 DUF4190 domain-containing protein [Microbacterium flavum]
MTDPKTSGPDDTEAAGAVPPPPAPPSYDSAPYVPPTAPTYDTGSYGEPSEPAAPAYAPPSYAPPAYPTSPYGAPPAPGYGATGAYPTGYPVQQSPGAPPVAPYGYGGYAPARRTNGLAVASMIVSILGIIWVLPLIGSVGGAIMGHIALGQVKRTGEAGRGMALAGVIVGWAGTALLVLGVLFFFFVVALGASSGARYGA